MGTDFDQSSPGRGAYQPSRSSSRLPVPQGSIRGIPNPTAVSIASRAVRKPGSAPEHEEKASQTGLDVDNRKDERDSWLSSKTTTTCTEPVGTVSSNSVSAVSTPANNTAKPPPSITPGAAEHMQSTAAVPDPQTIQSGIPREKRKPRPSLSDRTIDTLSHLPPSPSPSRRRSSFFNRDPSSPMKPPPRPTYASQEPSTRPPLPLKQPLIPSRAMLSIGIPDRDLKSSKGPMTQTSKPSNTVQSYKTTHHSRISGRSSLKPEHTQYSSEPSSKMSQTKTPLKNPAPSRSAQRKPLTSRQPATAIAPLKKTSSSRDPSSIDRSARTSSLSHQPQRPAFPSSQSCPPREAHKPATKFARSSAALRDAIAHAKREAGGKRAFPGITPESTTSKYKFGPETKSLDVLEHPISDAGLLKRRVKAALFSGHLNVAAMGLKSIPPEVKRMYDLSENVEIDWSECVDLTRLAAADNELETLEDDIFPDATNAELENAEGEEYDGQFRGLEALDLHSNLLKELPLGLRRLQNLRILNLSGNKLSMSSLDIVCQIGGNLTELKMSDNELSGMLPKELEDLRNLQTLDLQGNKISGLPESLKHLVNLKTLYLAQNRLSSAFFELLTHLSLVELTLSCNRLVGVLFSEASPSTMESLKLLDVSQNALEAFAAAEIVLPSLQVVNLSRNRIRAFPILSSWTELLTLGVADNLISEIPSNLVALRKLRNADFSNNNIKWLNTGIASLEELISISLAGNPLCERKYLTMSTDDLKADLQKRNLSTELSLDEEGSVCPPSSGSGSLLDFSARSLSDSTLPMPELDAAVLDLRLDHNALNCIPKSLLSYSSISFTLTTLDMSHNPLATTYLSSSVPLTQLKELSLSSCNLNSLHDLKSNLSAPKLSTLNVSANRLAGSLCTLRIAFSNLHTLLVSNNQISTLEVHAVEGLTHLDIRNNEIEHLNPALGLLGRKGGLECLEVTGNRFRVPRWDVLEKGTEAVMRYLRGRLPSEELAVWEDGVTD